MARIRSVKPDLRISRVVAGWPIPARYAWVLLWGYLDDYGRGIDDVRLIVADCFPLDRDVTERKMETWLKLYATAQPQKPAPLCRYTVAGQDYMHAVNWHEHQRVNRPTASRIPPCPDHERLTESRTESSLSGSRPEMEGEMEKEGEGDTGSARSLRLTERRTRPDPWCPKHPGGTDRPCGPCGIARRASTTWQPPTPMPPHVSELRAAGVIA